MFCKKCGAQLHAQAKYCHSCAEPVHAPGSEGWNEFAETLGKASLGAAKGIACAPMIAAAIASCAAALGLLAAAVYAFYQFTIGGVLALPRFMAASLPFDTLSGPVLFGAGLVALVAAILLALTVHALRKGLQSLRAA